MKSCRIVSTKFLAALTVITLTLSVGILSAQSPAPGAEWSSWWFGIYGGANINMFSGELHYLSREPGPGNTVIDTNVAIPTGFTEGSGIGLALGAVVEYNPGGLFGARLFVGYDNKSVTFTDRVVGSETQSLTASPAYVTIDPSLRINLGSRFFHLTLGPTIGINVAKGYEYKKGTGVSTHDMEMMRSLVLGADASLGYDIPLQGPDANLQILLTPFAAFRLSQNLREDVATDTNKFGVSTVRVGLQLKFAGGSKSVPPEEPIPTIQYSAKAPNVVTDTRKINETFPMRNYVFFDAGSTEIPSRYKKLSASDAASFKEEQLKTSAGTGGQDPLQVRSAKQMDVYYDGLNVLGDRLRSNPSSTVVITGAANGNAGTGKQMAESVKTYLVSSYGIDGSRITTEGKAMPTNRSGSGGTPAADKTLVDAENYRVEFTTNPPDLMRPVTITTTQEQLIDNDVVVTLANSDSIASWGIEITERGNPAVRSYGPFTTGSVRIDSKALLGAKREGVYTMNVKGMTKSGKVALGQQSEFRLVRADAGDEQTGNRYSILFEFDESRTVETYRTFLTQTVAPAIPDGASVIIHGHTDAIGEPDYNQRLSQRRCEEAMAILKAELDKAGKTVTFDSYGFGEDESRAMFNNTLPEQRFYNRTVVIEVVPKQ